MQPEALIGLVQGTMGGVVVMAFVILSFIKGWIVPGQVHNRLVDEYDRLLVTVEKSADALARVIPFLQDLERESRESRR